MNEFTPIAALFVTSLAGWLLVALRWHRTGRLLSAVPRIPVPWGLRDLPIFILLSLGLPAIASLAYLQLEGQSPQEFERLTQTANLPVEDARLRDHLTDGFTIANNVGKIAAVLLCGYLAWRLSQRESPDQRWNWARVSWIQDLKLAVTVFVLCIPPILLLKFALVSFFSTQIMKEHPLIERLNADPHSVSQYSLAIFSAVIVAPLFEEMLFRLLIQGSLERAAMGSPSSSTTSQLPHSHLPTIISSALFALLHMGHGVDPLPLFALGLMLGHLYRQTHRILPCIGVHFFLNSFTLCQLFMKNRG